MLAGVTDASQAQLLAEKAADPKWFGTPYAMDIRCPARSGI